MLLVKFQPQPAFLGRGGDPRKWPKSHLSIFGHFEAFLKRGPESHLGVRKWLLPRSKIEFFGK